MNDYQDDQVSQCASKNRYQGDILLVFPYFFALLVAIYRLYKGYQLYKMSKRLTRKRVTQLYFGMIMLFMCRIIGFTLAYYLPQTTEFKLLFLKKIFRNLSLAVLISMISVLILSWHEMFQKSMVLFNERDYATSISRLKTQLLLLNIIAYTFNIANIINESLVDTSDFSPMNLLLQFVANAIQIIPIFFYFIYYGNNFIRHMTWLVKQTQNNYTLRKFKILNQSLFLLFVGKLIMLLYGFLIQVINGDLFKEMEITYCQEKDDIIKNGCQTCYAIIVWELVYYFFFDCLPIVLMIYIIFPNQKIIVQISINPSTYTHDTQQLGGLTDEPNISKLSYVYNTYNEKISALDEGNTSNNSRILLLTPKISQIQQLPNFSLTEEDEEEDEGITSNDLEKKT